MSALQSLGGLVYINNIIIFKINFISASLICSSFARPSARVMYLILLSRGSEFISLESTFLLSGEGLIN